jgi:hypothetical protein
MRTSGLAAKATTTNAAETLIAASSSESMNRLVIINEGAVAGFFSIDSGTTWPRLPANSTINLEGLYVLNQSVQIKRVADGADLAGVWAFGYAGNKG